jgi:hypothetical protein
MPKKFWKGLTWGIPIGLMMWGLIFVGIGWASPSLICDPQTGVDHYKLTGPAWVPTSVIAQADGSIKMDCSSAMVGTTNLTVAACKNDPIWGEQCSVFVPFSFTRPGSPVSPVNTKLSP